MPSVDFFDARYTVDGYSGIAFYLTRFATVTFNGGSWDDSGEFVDDSHVVAIMVGDDREHIVDIDDLTLLAEDAYCAGCGQVGCGHG